MKRRSSSLKGFTLIEMLAVIAIIAIIFSISVPAFGPVMKTLKLRTAAENLADTLESARQHAKTSSEDCRVVFPIKGDMAYKSYKLYSYNEEKKQGKTVGKLEVLPNSIEIDKKSSFFNNANNIMTIPFPDDTSGSQVTAGYIKFKPSGSAEIAGNIYLTDPHADISKKITYSAVPRKVDIKDIEKG